MDKKTAFLLALYSKEQRITIPCGSYLHVGLHMYLHHTVFHSSKRTYIFRSSENF